MASVTMIQRVIRAVLRPSQQQMMLGRWRIGYSEETISKIIERANEDHCGTCVMPPKEPEKQSKEENKAVATISGFPPPYTPLKN
jgi:hypothetical protein